ncbi:hypothetical protein C8N32_10159 [Rhodovulum imhoffii]|uniref:Carbon monoxide dehydrogenase subunit G n=1 Tax=Rhodovulum imhoffii TaxID=365340 RepID=A0A2T5BW44_9RHOB|nr:carbon monoxide dehydrogenase subunit G [Rhodovulum imhoffii]MBK5935167.1 carbon monoxide dehydrogenase [Rhodovulum imhoffii]PTN03865.1 hypothetical protein C8N32_10159 [Rhodovulum imhoffii]
MELTGSRTLTANRETVWAHLTSPEVLRQTIPGCESLEGTLENGFEAEVTQKVGPVKATFHGTVTVSDIVPEESYTIAGEGKGGVAGFAKGRADVALADGPKGTELTYTVTAEIGGKLAQLGSRLLHGTARRLADKFFDNLQSAIEGPAGETSDEA